MYPMLDLILKIIDPFLFAIGAMFIFIELRTKFDRSFLYFGIVSVLLCAFVAIDIWGLSVLQNPKEQLYWFRLQHVLICWVCPFIVSYIFAFTHTNMPRIVQSVVFVSSIFTILFFTDLTLYTINGTMPTRLSYQANIHPGVVYKYIFIPYYIIFAALLIRFIIIKKIANRGQERRFINFHLIAFLVLITFGAIDLSVVLRILPESIPSFSIIGILGFVSIISYLFTEHLAQLIVQNKKTFSELQSAYKDLEEASTLKQIGQSTAIINHEIKNYMFIISGNATLLSKMEKLSEKGKELLDTISTTAVNLTNFSKDILDLSKAQIIKEKVRLSIDAVITTCIDRHFPKNRQVFDISDRKSITIHGDWMKLDHVFMNLFRNSMEAGATKINIRMVPGSHTACIVVEDNGPGCASEVLSEMFKAFYTTKKDKGGTGLGLSLVRAVVESHGGHISAYSINNPGQSGLAVNMTFPIFGDTEIGKINRKDNIILIKEGIPDIGIILQRFNNVNVKPYIVQSVDDFRKEKTDRSAIVLTSPEIGAEFGNSGSNIFIIKKINDSILVSSSASSMAPRPLSEEFILTELIGKVS